jgi:NAD(P)H-hydrate repair Nnr-like enzyme with NAD(P)H-hydrate dehydratase domain
MIVLVGTLPQKDLKLTAGKGALNKGSFTIDGQPFSLNRGTAAMMAACCAGCETYSIEAPYCVVTGDIGDGTGSIPLYDYLSANLAHIAPTILVVHYIMPNLPAHNRVLDAIEDLQDRPLLIADAGYMYVAKMSGCASSYTVFTPDLGELAFLADRKAPHPFYTRGFIFHLEDQPKELVEMAYEGKNAGRFLLVKGEEDYVCEDGQILEKITRPCVPELEAIGGTGDTITGLIAATLATGLPPKEALILSSRANRLAGRLTKPSPATQISEIIAMVPHALDGVQKE